jgi:hypothetical protein
VGGIVLQDVVEETLVAAIIDGGEYGPAGAYEQKPTVLNFSPI